MCSRLWSTLTRSVVKYLSYIMMLHTVNFLPLTALAVIKADLLEFEVQHLLYLR